VIEQPLWSVVVIAKNESQTLPRLVASLKEFQERGGEIVVCDTGSTDNTIEVARNLGCSVYEAGNQFIRTIDPEIAQQINKRFCRGGEPDIVKGGDTLFDYSAARNYAAALATEKFISMPDADECFTCLNINQINAEIMAGAMQFRYEFVFSHDVYGNPDVTFQHCKFYHRDKLRWQGIIHEILVPYEK
jgi:glycosyltransferase involved in cell wall biosynthesis